MRSTAEKRAALQVVNTVMMTMGRLDDSVCAVRKRALLTQRLQT